MLVMPGRKTISTNTQHRRVLLFFVNILGLKAEHRQGLKHEHTTSAGSIIFCKYFRFESGTPTRAQVGGEIYY
jgi:hypothetical protein